MQLSFEENALSRELDADKARQAKRRAAGDESFLAGGQIEITPMDCDDAVHDAQELTAATDGMHFDGRQPRLLHIILELLAVGIRAPMPR